MRQRFRIPAATAILLITLTTADAANLGTRPAKDGPAWAAQIQMVDEALARKDVSAAARAWRGAHSAALGSRDWAGLIAAGDAALRIGELSGSWKAHARQAYLEAFYRARNQRSVEGVLRTVEAFAALGDREVARDCMRVAEELAARTGDPQLRDRVRALADQLAVQLVGTTSLR